MFGYVGRVADTAYVDGTRDSPVVFSTRGGCSSCTGVVAEDTSCTSVFAVTAGCWTACGDSTGTKMTSEATGSAIISPCWCYGCATIRITVAARKTGGVATAWCTSGGSTKERTRKFNKAVYVFIRIIRRIYCTFVARSAASADYTGMDCRDPDAMDGNLESRKPILAI